MVISSRISVRILISFLLAVASNVSTHSFIIGRRRFSCDENEINPCSILDHSSKFSKSLFRFKAELLILTAANWISSFLISSMSSARSSVNPRKPIKGPLKSCAMIEKNLSFCLLMLDMVLFFSSN